MMARAARGVAALLAVALLAACANRAPPPPPPPAPAPRPPQAAAPSCFAQLDARGVGYERLPDFRTGEGCGIDQNVRIDRSAIPWNRPSLVSCKFEITEWDFETGVVQPAALGIFHRKVAQLIHVGTYACRGERGGDPNRLSQHAFGKAIDISGFTLDDGTKISVRYDWAGDGPKARFLHQVAKGACALFDVVLTPNHNAFHVDHIHLDIGPYKLCGM
jgi:hypothetical protein